MARFDLHVHSWYSLDAASRPEDLIEAARRVGLDGIAITDHDTCEAHDYCLERGLANADGTPVDGFLVVPGVEVSTADGHLLCLGTTLPDLAGRPALEVCAAVIQRGGVPVPAHPFDAWRHGIKAATLDKLPLTALEVFNAAVSSRSFNAAALHYADGRGLRGLAGSDAHHASAVGISHTELTIGAISVGSVVEAIRTTAFPAGTYLSRREALKKHFANFLRAAKRSAPRR